MRITALLENTTKREDMQTEHGLSLYIETENQKILFDMGQTDMFAANAKALGIDLAQVDIAILSHGHYDHGGGLKKFTEINSRAPIFMSKYAFLPHYNGTQKYIGLDTSLETSSQIVFVGDEHKINECLSLFSCNAETRRYSFGCGGLTEKVGDSFIDDDFRHEIYLCIEENGRKILISGCSHKGILDITEWFSPDTLIGGFHFSKMPLDDTLKKAAEKLGSADTEFYTCHCTGSEQYIFMKKHMHNLNYLSCGQTVTV